LLSPRRRFSVAVPIPAPDKSQPPRALR
jgi:hypothetical protein